VNPAAKTETVLPLAASFQLTEKPHLGHRLPTAVLYPGITPANSNTASGLRVCLYDSGRRSRSTGKERDAESGLDWFEARYFSGAQGRFSSPDRVIVTPARLQDPQRFNLYSYARNNPFTFVDPNGEDIDFANDTDEGRKKALALITKNLSADEAANIGIRQTKDGSYEAYVIDKNAIGKDDASSAYNQVTGLINDHSIVADVGVIGGGLTATFNQGALAGFGSISSWSQNDSVFAPSTGSKYVDVLVTQGNLPGGVQVACCNGKGVYQGVEPDFITMWHELVGETLKYRAGHGDLLHNPDLDNRTVIKIENEMRAVQGMNPRTGADHGQTVITVNGNLK
jgi:RHS repeat-associated protein